MPVAELALFAAGLGAGAVLMPLLARRLPRRPRSQLWRFPGLDPSQVLRWLDAAPTGWLIIDGHDVVRLINPRAERFLEVGGAALLHPQPLDQICSDPELLQLVADTRRRERPLRLEWQRSDQDLEVQALPGDRGWVALLLQSRRSLEAQLEQQERWVSDVAHELKTPLTALMLVGDSLAAHVNSNNVVLVERLQRELRRLQALVGDLLELSRLENTLPAAGLRRELVDLEDLVHQVWSGLRPLAEERRIQLDLQQFSATGTGALLADGSRLHRALLNLIDNAIRYSPDQASIHVRIRYEPGWCRLSVRDEGEGLSDEDSLRLFERFYRGDPARARSSRGGTGLGLPIVQQIAHAHGGRVQASNHPQGGALLELVLPLGG